MKERRDDWLMQNVLQLLLHLKQVRNWPITFFHIKNKSIVTFLYWQIFKEGNSCNKRDRVKCRILLSIVCTFLHQNRGPNFSCALYLEGNNRSLLSIGLYRGIPK